MEILEMLPDQPVIDASQLKGLFIPGEIFYNQDLTPQEVLLLSLIWWLDGKPHHCYASNKYLAKHLHISEKRISNIITQLRKKDLVQILSWNGKFRVMRCTQK